MTGTIRFQFDDINNIHFAYPNWHIETEEDCQAWFHQFEEYFSRFDHKVDTIIVLDHFRIGPKIGSVWGKYRAAWITRFTRYSVRIHADARVSTFNATSAALYGGGYEEARDIPSAVDLIKARRRADGVS